MKHATIAWMGMGTARCGFVEMGGKMPVKHPVWRHSVGQQAIVLSCPVLVSPSPPMVDGVYYYVRSC